MATSVINNMLVIFVLQPGCGPNASMGEAQGAAVPAGSAGAGAGKMAEETTGKRRPWSNEEEMPTDKKKKFEARQRKAFNALARIRKTPSCDPDPVDSKESLTAAAGLKASAQALPNSLTACRCHSIACDPAHDGIARCRQRQRPAQCQ